MKQYIPLYLKYRPQKLSELIGQEVVSKTLSNALLHNKVVHAYLFCGPKGTGKTSTARILAKSLNCEVGITQEPCDKCVSCISIIKGNSLDVIEIDAASHRKVEDAEDLLNRVNLGTYGSRYKVYIIDEVHMLTDHAFNALLKTLEEPPKNVIFVLATTEEYKVIPTIISRCQKLEFKAIPFSEIEKKILEISKKENINIDCSIEKFISRRSNGCLRDAISLLDQISVLQNKDEKINPCDVFELFGTVNRDTLLNLACEILSCNSKASINLTEELIKSGKDLGEILTNLLELFIDLTKAKIDIEYRKVLEAEFNSGLEVLEKITENHLIKIIEKLHDAQSRLRLTLSQELQFMAEIICLLTVDGLPAEGEARQRRQSTVISKPLTVDSLPLTVKSLQSTVDSQQSTPLDDLWPKIISLIESNPTKTLLTQSGSYLINLSEEVLEIGLSKDMFLPRLEKDEKKKEMILKAAQQVSGMESKTIKFKIGLRPESTAESPQLQKISLSEFKSTTNETKNEDEVTRTLKDLLGAKQID